MERYVTWYALQLKAWCTQKICWFQILGMCLILAVVMSISMPKTDNLLVGVCNIEGKYQDQMVDILENSDSIFSFQRYTDEEAMRNDIVTGRLECGFSFLEEFDEKIESTDVKESIKYIETPFSTKGSVARETFYTAFLQVYGEQILRNSIMDTYGSYDEEIEKELLEKNQEYLGSDLVFQIEQKSVKTNEREKEESGKTYPIQGLVGLFIFGMMFMEHGRKFESGKKAVFHALSVREQRIFELLGYFAVVTVAAVVGMIWILNCSCSRGIVVELLRMIFYLLYGGVWILFVGRFLKNQTAFMAWTVTLLVMQMFLCPVFVDVSTYVKALRYIRYLFPLGIYV